MVRSGNCQGFFLGGWVSIETYELPILDGQAIGSVVGGIMLVGTD